MRGNQTRKNLTLWKILSYPAPLPSLPFTGNSISWSRLSPDGFTAQIRPAHTGFGPCSDYCHSAPHLLSSFLGFCTPRKTYIAQGLFLLYLYKYVHRPSLLMLSSTSSNTPSLISQAPVSGPVAVYLMLSSYRRGP